MAQVVLPCIDCGEPVDPRHRGSLAEVIGFAKSRKGGGQNHVLFRQETGRWMCGTCAVRRKFGISTVQQPLFP